MKIRMLDTVETAHTIVPEFEFAEIADQPGVLTILSREITTAGGIRGENFVLLIRGGQVAEVPDRLAKRLVGTGHAVAA